MLAHVQAIVTLHPQVNDKENMYGVFIRYMTRRIIRYEEARSIGKCVPSFKPQVLEVGHTTGRHIRAKCACVCVWRGQVVRLRLGCEGEGVRL